MSGYSSPGVPDNEQHRHALSVSINAVRRAETENVGQFTVPAGQSEYVLEDPRIRAGRVIHLSPRNAVAADMHWWIEETAHQRATIAFLPAAEEETGEEAEAGEEAPAVFAYSIHGTNDMLYTR